MPIDERSLLIPPSENTAAAPSQIPQQNRYWRESYAIVTSWFLPARTAERTNGASLRAAWLVHFIAMLIATGVGVLVAIYLEPDVYRELIDESRDAIYWLQRSPLINGILLISPVLAIEAAFVGIALLLMPWGARLERKRDSFRCALRRCWLQSPALIPGILFFFITIFYIGDARSRWWQAPQRASVMRYDPPVPPPGVTQPSPQWNKYQDELSAYVLERGKKMEALRRTMPWYIRDSGFIAPLFALGLAAYLIWGQFRAAGAPRAHAHVDQPPLCESCGYDLSGSDPNGRCPECGTPVVDSLSPDHRTGPPWEQRLSLGHWPAWCRTARLIWQPAQLGRSLHVCDAPTDHRGFLGRTLIIVAAINALSFFVLMSIARLLMDDAPDLDLTFLLMTMFIAFVLTLTGLVLLLLIALATGFLRMEQRRTLFPAAIQSACYLSPFVAFQGVLLQFTIFLTAWFLTETDRMNATGPTPAQVFFYFGVCIVLPNLILLAIFVRKVYAATKAARFANH